MSLLAWLTNLRQRLEEAVAAVQDSATRDYGGAADRVTICVVRDGVPQPAQSTGGEE